MLNFLQALFFPQETSSSELRIFYWGFLWNVNKGQVTKLLLYLLMVGRAV